MVDVGDDAPTFEAPLSADGVAQTRLQDHLDAGPVVLAFFAAAFSGTCTAEMAAFDDRREAFAARSATVLGVSTDLPWTLSEFREAEGLSVGLLSDNDAAIAESYGVCTTYERLDVPRVARRSVFVVDTDGTVVDRWLADDPGQEPDYDAVLDAVDAIASGAAD
ncbi:MAG: redoxin domain-containing protein [Halolamina sp.]